MFTAFFYLLRDRGLKVSLQEWVSLLEGCEKGLHRCSLNGFYQLCRAVLVKSEADFDRFDQAFLEFFRDVPRKGELPEELLEWLNHPAEDLGRTISELEAMGLPKESVEDILKMLEERLKEQTEEHNGGSYWVGTQGRSPFGNSGVHPGGIRIGGVGRNRTAALVAGERRYRDFRRDNRLDTRQFQMAFRLLRQLSTQADDQARELDVDGTVHATCDNGGLLHVEYRKARRNAVKVLLLMDSGGSMEYYSGLCSRLFQAARQSNHFKEVHTYYFHNCVYGRLYEDPTLHPARSVPTDWLLANFDDSYRVILVGDAEMSPYELKSLHYNWATSSYEQSGLEQLVRIKERYPYLVWLNPQPLPTWENYWSETHLMLARMFPMFDLTVEGLEQGMRRLMAKR